MLYISIPKRNKHIPALKTKADELGCEYEDLGTNFWHFEYSDDLWSELAKLCGFQEPHLKESSGSNIETPTPEETLLLGY